MQLMDQELSPLIARGIQNGFLTYDEVNAYLPDEDVNPEKLDKLLLAIERHGIELIEASEMKRRVAAARSARAQCCRDASAATEHASPAEHAPLVAAEDAQAK